MDDKECLERVRNASRIEIEKLAAWMVRNGYATGHGESMDALLKELEWQVVGEQVAWLTDTEEAFFDKEEAKRASDGFIQPLYIR